MVSSVGQGWGAGVYAHRWALGLVGVGLVVAAVAYIRFTRSREEAEAKPPPALPKKIEHKPCEEPEPFISPEVISGLGLNFEEVNCVGDDKTTTLKTVTEVFAQIINYLVKENNLQKGQKLILNLSLPAPNLAPFSAVCEELARYKWHSSDQECADVLTDWQERPGVHWHTKLNVVEAPLPGSQQAPKEKFWLNVITQALLQKGRIAHAEMSWWQTTLDFGVSYNIYITV